MKKVVLKLALAALVVTGGIAMATPAHAVSYYDSYGRPYYYNTWGQPVYYDTGYNASATTSAPAARYTQTTYSAASAAQPVYSYAQPGYQQTTYSAASAAQPVYSYAQPGYQQTTYSAPAYTQQPAYQQEQPLMAAVPPAPDTYAPANASQTTYQYYYPDGTTAQTTYVSSSTSAPVAASTVCRQTSRTDNQWGGEIQTRYTTECRQSDGTWLEQ